MDKDKAAYINYLARQNFSEEEIENLHKGKPEYKEREEQDADL